MKKVQLFKKFIVLHNKSYSKYSFFNDIISRTILKSNSKGSDNQIKIIFLIYKYNFDLYKKYRSMLKIRENSISKHVHNHCRSCGSRYTQKIRKIGHISRNQKNIQSHHHNGKIYYYKPEEKVAQTYMNGLDEYLLKGSSRNQRKITKLQKTVDKLQRRLESNQKQLKRINSENIFLHSSIEKLRYTILNQVAEVLNKPIIYNNSPQTEKQTTFSNYAENNPKQLQFGEKYLPQTDYSLNKIDSKQRILGQNQRFRFQENPKRQNIRHAQNIETYLLSDDSELLTPQVKKSRNQKYKSQQQLDFENTNNSQNLTKKLDQLVIKQLKQQKLDEKQKLRQQIINISKKLDKVKRQYFNNA